MIDRIELLKKSRQNDSVSEEDFEITLKTLEALNSEKPKRKYTTRANKEDKSTRATASSANSGDSSKPNQ